MLSPMAHAEIVTMIDRAGGMRALGSPLPGLEADLKDALMCAGEQDMDGRHYRVKIDLGGVLAFERIKRKVCRCSWGECCCE